MPKKENNPSKSIENIPNATTAALLGKQSVRATFRLSEECINALQVVATQLGIKQKSLFDHLVGDAQLLKSIAHNLKDTASDPSNRMVKTYVISRNALRTLSQIVDRYGASRDALIECSVQRLMPIIAQEKKNYDKRKQILGQMRAHYKEGRQMLRHIKKQFGPDDMLYKKYNQVMTSYGNCTEDMKKFIEKGKAIEQFEVGAWDR